MEDYILIIREHGRDFENSPEEYQALIARFMEWTRSLQDAGSYVTSAKLSYDGGKTARSRDGELVIDGPYAEAREAVAGFYQVRARDFSDAARIASGCPIIAYGGSVEIRAVDTHAPGAGC